MNRNEWIWDFNANDHKITFLSLSLTAASSLCYCFTSSSYLLPSSLSSSFHLLSSLLSLHLLPSRPQVFILFLSSTHLLSSYFISSCHFYFLFRPLVFHFPVSPAFFAVCPSFEKHLVTVIITARKSLGNVTNNEAVIHKIREQSINNTVGSKYRPKFDNWTKSEYD